MIHTQDADFTLYLGDVMAELANLPNESVHCVVTSPPYWGLRDYGTGEWAGGDADHVHDTKGARNGRGGSGAPGKQTEGAFPSELAVDECSCGARRVDQQLGLEPTPDQYVARMVEVFREVRRVLRPDGTCWVNLGDSYLSNVGGKPDGADTKGGVAGHVPNAWGGGSQSPVDRPSYLKPKDLAGMPWRVAFALQQPYYNGSIQDERDRIWLAAMVDAEGSIGINLQRGGDHRPNDIYSVSVKIHNCSEAVVRRCAEIAGTGSVAIAETRRRPVYAWSVYGANARQLLRELYPHLVAKQHEARLAYANEACVGEAAKARYEGLRQLHRGSESPVDAAPPPSCLEPGWYLRSDIIWAKPNPMPESVTDRPTKSHEYVFLLTKSPRYFFDQEAVREPHTRDWSGDAGLIGDGNSRWAELAGRHDYNGRTAPPQMNPAGRNVRTVWDIATQPYPGAHFATYPEELVRRCVLAGSSERGCCPVCGKPWEREVEKPDFSQQPKRGGDRWDFRNGDRTSAGQKWQAWRDANPDKQLGWRPGCRCHGGLRPITSVPSTVLDPFLGSGTTAYVARKHGRRSIGIELNPAYADLAARRMAQQSLFGLEPTPPVLERHKGLTGGAYNPACQSPHSNAR